MSTKRWVKQILNFKKNTESHHLQGSSWQMWAELLKAASSSAEETRGWVLKDFCLHSFKCAYKLSPKYESNRKTDGFCTFVSCQSHMCKTVADWAMLEGRNIRLVSPISEALYLNQRDLIVFLFTVLTANHKQGKKSSTLRLSHTHIVGLCGAWKITGLYHLRPWGGC